MKLTLPILLLLVVSPCLAFANVIISEDFESATAVTYTQSAVEDNTSGNTTSLDSTLRNGRGTFEDCYGQVGIADIDQGYTGFGGSSFWAAQNTDGDTSFTSDEITLNWSGIDISNFTNLTFSGDFASFENLSDPAWDPTTSLRVQAQIDGGGFFNVLGFESINNTATNTAVREDTDFVDATGNGAFAGEGTLLDDAFQTFTRNINGVGNTLDFRIIVDQLNGNGEDIAFDNISIDGDIQGVPEPTSFLLFGSALGACVLPRRRKSLFSFLSKS